MATLPGLGQDWFISPEFTIPPPPDGPLRLGVLLADPKELNSVIWDAQNIALGSAVFHSVQDRYEFSSSRIHGTRGAVWASFLSVGLGLGTDAATSREDSIMIACEKLETHFFSPTMEFIGECLEHSEVKAWTRAQRRKPLYMVTGIKVAHGAQLKTEQRKSSPFKAGEELGSIGIGVDVVAAGSLASVGPSLPVSSTAISGFQSASYSTDFVFAYQLRKLKFSKIRPYLRTYDAGDKKAQDAGAVPSSSTKSAPDQPISESPQTHVFQQDDTEDAVEVETEEVDAPDIDKPLRILSLDGGGVRGISSLLLLEKIMDKVREESDLQAQVEVGTSSEGPRNSKQSSSIQPCQYFDLICGTSTGGLIAILLGRLQCVSTAPGSHWIWLIA